MNQTSKPNLLFPALLFLTSVFGAVPCSLGQRLAKKNSLAIIRESDLKADLFTLASDQFKGREAGTLDELNASAWIAERLRAMGLQPAGDNGTFFQFFHLQRTRISETSQLTIGKHPLTFGQDVIIRSPAIASVDAPLLFVGKGTPSELAGVDIKGKAIALELSASETVRLSYPVEVIKAMNKHASELLRAGAAAVVLVSNPDAQYFFDMAQTQKRFQRGRYDLPGGPDTRVFSQAPTVWLPMSALAWIKEPNQRFTNIVNVESFQYPSMNVVAKVVGTDPILKNEYVLFSTHQDHEGIRGAVAGDSILNGADDNASGCVATMAVGRAFAQQPGKRSALFVFHGAEERGLLGSRYYATTPTVPKESIVAVLNAEMIGRNAPDSLALIGADPSHRTSTDLVDAAQAINASSIHFKLDTLWDKPNHPEGFYFRSDHLPYAQAGIPAVMFTALLHGDYHTPKDESDRINTAKVTRVARWIYLTGWEVANRRQRVQLDKGVNLER